jgi:hypothetical protein
MKMRVGILYECQALLPDLQYHVARRRVVLFTSVTRGNYCEISMVLFLKRIRLFSLDSSISIPETSSIP